MWTVERETFEAVPAEVAPEDVAKFAVRWDCVGWRREVGNERQIGDDCEVGPDRLKETLAGPAFERDRVPRLLVVLDRVSSGFRISGSTIHPITAKVLRADPSLHSRKELAVRWTEKPTA